VTWLWCGCGPLLLKSVNVVKIVSYVNYEDCVARNANEEECRIVLPGYSRERGNRVFNTPSLHLDWGANVTDFMVIVSLAILALSVSSRHSKQFLDRSVGECKYEDQMA
jgi:hypothetical protein